MTLEGLPQWDKSSSAGGSSSGPIERLRSLGVDVHDKGDSMSLGWDDLAGNDTVKEKLAASVLLAIQHPEIYEDIAKQTRQRFEPNRVKAVLFDGPPGVGKTLSARILASQSGLPFVYVPVETVMSKWFGEAEKNLEKIFSACEELGQCIIFIDEVDSLAANRDSPNGIHEASRRLLSVLLRKLEGFREKKRTIVISATNRRQDLDQALLSRFDQTITFNLPDARGRSAIFQRYAKHLDPESHSFLAQDAVSANFSGRDIKEACQNAERDFAAEVIAGRKKGLPQREEYARACAERSQVRIIKR